MLKLFLLFSTFFFLFILHDTKIFAQQKEDTLLLKADSAKIDTTEGKVLVIDTTKTKKHDPRIATFRSAVLPGWGQAYNRKYWKIPIIYAALGTTAAIFVYNLNTYKSLREAVILRSDDDPSNDNQVNPDFINLSTESIRSYRNEYRQNVDYSALVFLLFWGLNVVDATVDAHLKAFDVSSDLSMRIRPGFNSITNGPGISFVFFFKDNHSKALLPLP